MSINKNNAPKINTELLDAAIEKANNTIVIERTGGSLIDGKTETPVSKLSLQELTAKNLCPYCLKSNLNSSDEEPNVTLKNKAEYHAHCYHTMLSTIKRYRKLGYTVTLNLPTE